MRKVIFTILIMATSLALFTGCDQVSASMNNLQDGTYRAEFKDYDAYGWKDFVEVSVINNELYEVTFDAVSSKDNSLKSEDTAYKAQMEAIVGTYPAKYNKDIINQFIESQKVTAIDTVAGATLSTDNFKALITAAMLNAGAGNSEVAIISNINAN